MVNESTERDKLHMRISLIPQGILEDEDLCMQCEENAESTLTTAKARDGRSLGLVCVNCKRPRNRELGVVAAKVMALDSTNA